jgi:hypothetical protein
MYSDQTGLFPQVSSLGNKYIMVIHNIDSNSSWVEALKNSTGGELFLGCTQALERMQKAGIIPKHQVLDNQASAAYKKAIGNSDVTYELVPPNNHQRNMAEKAIQTFMDHFVSVLSGCAPSCCTSGADFSLRWSDNFFYSNNRNYIPTCPPMHMLMVIIATTNIHLFQLGWRHWYMTNLTNIKPMQNTEKRRLSLAHTRNTIGVRNSSRRQPKLLKSWVPRSSSTNT